MFDKGELLKKIHHNSTFLWQTRVKVDKKIYFLSKFEHGWIYRTPAASKGAGGPKSTYIVIKKWGKHKDGKILWNLLDKLDDNRRKSEIYENSTSSNYLKKILNANRSQTYIAKEMEEALYVLRLGKAPGIDSIKWLYAYYNKTQKYFWKYLITYFKTMVKYVGHRINQSHFGTGTFWVWFTWFSMRYKYRYSGKK